MKNLLLTFDIEEFDAPSEYGINISKTEQFKISYDGTKRILDLLEKTRIKAIFFVTASFAKKYPKLIRKISEKNEIGLHAFEHKDDYEEMDRLTSKKRLKEAKSIIERIINKKIIGFRAPRMKKPDNKILSEIGMKYDTSLHPTYVPGRYNNLLKKRKPFFSKGILEIPISVTALFRLPFSFIWFRNLPLFYSKICTIFNLDYINIYFHPWEFIDISKKVDSNKMPLLIIRNTGLKLKKKLEKYIVWCKKKGFKDITLSEYYNMNKDYLKTKDI